MNDISLYGLIFSRFVLSLYGLLLTPFYSVVLLTPFYSVVLLLYSRRFSLPLPTRLDNPSLRESSLLSLSLVSSPFSLSFHFPILHTQFDLYANEIVRSSRANAVSKVEVAQSVAIGITSYASDREQSFPFVTLPDFEKRVGKARALSDSEIISWSPLVADADREEWEAYSAANGQWLRESLVELGMGDTPAFISPRIIDGVGTPVDGPIFTNEDAGPVRNMYAVLWYVVGRKVTNSLEDSLAKLTLVSFRLSTFVRCDGQANQSSLLEWGRCQL